MHFLPSGPIINMKAQITVEFMSIMVILLLAVSVISVVAINKNIEIISLNRQREAMDVLNMAGERINTAYMEGDGFITNFTLPDRIYGSQYAIFLDSNILSVSVQNITYVKPLLTKASGPLKPGENMARNQNGVVVIT